MIRFQFLLLVLYLSTDGDVAVVLSQDCEIEAAGATSAVHPGNKVFRYARKQILTFRSDIWRANILYGAYDLTRIAVNAVRHSRGAHPEIGQARRPVLLSPSPQSLR